MVFDIFVTFVVSGAFREKTAESGLGNPPPEPRPLP
jgi:hypothetical protein